MFFISEVVRYFFSRYFEIQVSSFAYFPVFWWHLYRLLVMNIN